MNEYLSKKIKVISFISIIAVVFIHAYNYYDSFLLSNTRIHEGTNICAMIEFFFSNAFTRFAVPLFFAISGYLFFRSFEASIKGYANKIKKRAYSLLLPYVLWTILAGIAIIVLAVCFNFYNIPIVAQHVYSMNNGGAIAWLLSSPAFQLWFVKDLIIYVVISPLIYLCNKQLKGIPIVILVILWILNINFFINGEGFLFFNIGAYIAINSKEELILKKSGLLKYIASFLWIAGCTFYTMISAGAFGLNFGDIVLNIFYKVNVITGVIAMWLIADSLCDKYEDIRILRIGGSNVFLVYVLHEPLQHFIYQFILTKSNGDLVHIILYVVIPFIFIILGITISKVLRNTCPLIHKVITGGR